MRRNHDFYETPEPLIRSLLEVVPSIIKPYDTVFEPCAGNHAITRVLESRKAIVITNDIKKRADQDFYLDMTSEHSWREVYSKAGGPFNWVITNPPFKHAGEIFWRGWPFVKDGMALLLRLTFLEPVKSRKLFLSHRTEQMSDLIIFGSPRPSFTKEGTDSVTTAWMVWKRGWEGGTRIQYVTDWKQYGCWNETR